MLYNIMLVTWCMMYYDCGCIVEKENYLNTSNKFGWLLGNSLVFYYYVTWVVPPEHSTHINNIQCERQTLKYMLILCNASSLFSSTEICDLE